MAQEPDRVISAPDAAAYAEISYRQLDHWARRGWVVPAGSVGVGRAGRRLYGVNGVLGLAALGHFARSGLDVAKLGPALNALDLPVGTDFVIVGDDAGELKIVHADQLRYEVGRPGMRAVFDPASLMARLAGDKAQPCELGKDLERTA
jgi:hypothetical protein